MKYFKNKILILSRNGTNAEFDAWREKVPNVVFGVEETRFLQALGGDGPDFPWPDGHVTSDSLKTFLEADRDLLCTGLPSEFNLFDEPIYTEEQYREGSVSSDLTLPDEQIATSETPVKYLAVTICTYCYSTGRILPYTISAQNSNLKEVIFLGE